MWQKCPICDGEGRVTSNGLSSSVHQVCSVCKGARIISELNGLPAQSAPTVSNMERVQTAVEWFAFQIMDSWNDIQNGKISIDELIQQAKQMEKEQSKQDYDAGLFDGTMDDVKDRLYKNAEQYYNETYGKSI